MGLRPKSTLSPEQRKENQLAYQRMWRKTPRGRKNMREKANRRSAKIREYLKALKEVTPCSDCGGNFPHYVMHFDHIRDKRDNIGRLLGTGWRTIERELEKCEIVCANCHAIRTWKRNQVN